MINYNPETSKNLNDGMDIGGGVELPWLCPPVWVLNGDPKLRAMATMAPALYFGGFAANFDDLQAAGEDHGIGFPNGFVETDLTSRDNKPLKVLVARNVFVAPFGVRKSWVNKDRIRTAQFALGSRQHIQVLAVLANKEQGGVFTPLYPVLLSAKGWQAQHLERSFSTWASKTANMRRKLARSVNANDIPAWAFYCAIGTFGQEPKVEMVGNGNDKSPITPIGPFLPKEITEQTLEALFVGQEVIDYMLTLKDEAKEWLSAWAALDAGNKQPSAPAPDEYPEPPMPVMPEDELPFLSRQS